MEPLARVVAGKCLVTVFLGFFTSRLNLYLLKAVASCTSHYILIFQNQLFKIQ